MYLSRRYDRATCETRNCSVRRALQIDVILAGRPTSHGVATNPSNEGCISQRGRSFLRRCQRLKLTVDWNDDEPWYREPHHYIINRVIYLLCSFLQNSHCLLSFHVDFGARGADFILNMGKGPNLQSGPAAWTAKGVSLSMSFAVGSPSCKTQPTQAPAH